MKLKMNDCLLLILSFLTGWYVCNRYHRRDRLVEGFDYPDMKGWGWIVILVFFAVVGVYCRIKKC